MRVSNLNSFSAILDRLVIENLKLIYFTDKGDEKNIKFQNELLTALKEELDIICEEIGNNEYKSLEEKRTFDSDNLFSNLFQLCLNNFCISKYDKLKINECNKEIINVNNLKNYIFLVRENLEQRSRAKNNLEL